MHPVQNSRNIEIDSESLSKVSAYRQAIKDNPSKISDFLAYTIVFNSRSEMQKQLGGSYQDFINNTQSLDFLAIKQEAFKLSSNLGDVLFLDYLMSFRRDLLQNSDLAVDALWNEQELEIVQDSLRQEEEYAQRERLKKEEDLRYKTRNDYRSINSENAQREGFFRVNESENSFKFDAAEVIGDRKDQEDKLAIVQVNIDHALDYFQKRFYKMLDSNSNSDSGSTASMYYLDPQRKEITVANLGDSRVYIVLKNKITGESKAILLTQDHSPESQRVQNHIEGNGGSIIRDRDSMRILTPGSQDADSSFGVGGAIGDCVMGNQLVRIPDVVTFNLQYLIMKSEMGLGENGLADYNFTIINACDGLTDHVADNNCEYIAEFSQSENGTLVEIIRDGTFDSENGLLSVIEKKAQYIGLAEHLTLDAYNSGSQDNISVGVCSFDGGSSSQNGVLGWVLDGHSGSEVSFNCHEYMKLHAKELLRGSHQGREDMIDYLYNNVGSKLSYGSKFSNSVLELEREIMNNNLNSDPKRIYRGIGVKSDIVDDVGNIVDFNNKNQIPIGFRIKDVFSPDVLRFRDLDDRYVDIEKGQVITSIVNYKGETISIKDIFLSAKTAQEAKSSIVEYFHSNKEIVFGMNDGSFYKCDNSKNKSAIFMTQKDSKDSSKSNWSCFEEIINKGDVDLSNIDIFSNRNKYSSLPGTSVKSPDYGRQVVGYNDVPLPYTAVR